MNRLFSSIIIALLIISHKAKGEDYQLSFANSDELGNAINLYQSVFTHDVGYFLKNIFNAPAYAQNFLPQNFFHLMELLEFCNAANKDPIHVKSILRLFTNKMKATAYIHPSALGRLLETLPATLEPYFIIPTDRMVISLKDLIYSLQYQTLQTNFPEFKTNPEIFLESLSEQIENAVELRKLIFVFLEIALNKLVWNIEDQEQTWYQAKSLAEQLGILYKSTIISDIEDLNSLCITIIERYCYLLELLYANISTDTLEKIKNDVVSGGTLLLDLEESEDVLETKSQRLASCIDSLIALKVRELAREKAREAGIVI